MRVIVLVSSPFLRFNGRLVLANASWRASQRGRVGASAYITGILYKASIAPRTGVCISHNS